MASEGSRGRILSRQIWQRSASSRQYSHRFQLPFVPRWNAVDAPSLNRTVPHNRRTWCRAVSRPPVRRTGPGCARGSGFRSSWCFGEARRPTSRSSPGNPIVSTSKDLAGRSSVFRGASGLPTRRSFGLITILGIARHSRSWTMTVSTTSSSRRRRLCGSGHRDAGCSWRAQTDRMRNESKILVPRLDATIRIELAREWATT
jgi:hypothetical protein